MEYQDKYFQKIKPYKWSYIFFHPAIVFSLALFFLSCIYIFCSSFFTINYQVSYSVPVLFLGLFFILSIFVIVAYKKEKYIFAEQKITRESGTIFSNNSVDIKIQKITQVSLVLGFFQYLFFKTGNIVIKTAGSSSSKIVLKNIKNSEKVYEEVQMLMKNNGYHLKQDTLVQEEKPHILGIFEEIFRGFGSFLIFLLYIFLSILMDKEKIYEDLPSVKSYVSMIDNFWLLVAIFIIIIGVFGFSFLCKYLDLKKRKYQVFTDSIVYQEGFLTKYYSFLPMERIADSENQQNFFSRIFGLHDVIVSSEGTKNRIVFKNMVNGEHMMKNIKYIKNDITLIKKENPQEDGEIGYKNMTEKAFEYDKSFTAKYKMNPLKTFFLTIIWTIGVLISLFVVGSGDIEYIILFFIPAIIASAQSIISIHFTDYSIEESSIDKRYHFFTNKHRSFSIDKITYVKIRESLIDLVFKTCSIEFYSIGGSGGIIFKNIKKSPELEKNILQKVGIFETEPSREFHSDFSFFNFIKSHARIFFIMLVFAVLGIIFPFLGVVKKELFDISYLYSFSNVFAVCILLFLLLFVYQKIFFSQKFYKQILTKEYFMNKKGIIIRKKEYARVDNIKGVTAKKYPFTNTGELILNISGEVAIEDEKTGKSYFFASLNINMPYMPDIFLLHDYIDGILLEKIPDTTQQVSSGEDVGNSILISLPVLLLCIFVCFFYAPEFLIFISVLAFLIIVWEIIYIKSIKYIIEQDRIFSKKGIIYRTHQSIVFTKFDFMEKKQSFDGKIFRNGSLMIYTLGSGGTDMVLRNISKYDEIYEILKK